MDFSEDVRKKISSYHPEGELGRTAQLFLAFCGINHPLVKAHMERVAILSEKTAIRLKKDKKAAFFAGLLHDVGKILFDYRLFDGHNINREEYREVKNHAVAGFEMFKKFHLFTAYCAGAHHSMYNSGYGLEVKDFPKEWSLATIKKVLEISAIISICDFIDAFTHRVTEIKDGSDKGKTGLKDMLEAKYPNDHQIVRIALEENKKLNAK